MRFLDLTISDDVPDSKTVWNFREKLIDLEIVNELFDLFLNSLEKIGLIVNQGKIINASFVEVPTQRNKKEENATIKKGEIPESFQEKPKYLNNVGSKHISAIIGLMNLTYNMFRKVQLMG